MHDLNDLLARRLVYQTPRMREVTVRKDIVYKTALDVRLPLDLYYPPEVRAESLPAVVFVHGDASHEILRVAKDWGQFVSWGQLAAASGFIGVTFNHRSSERRTKLREAASDVEDLIRYVRTEARSLNIAGDSLCVWTCSAGPPFVLPKIFREAPTYIKCAVVLYGLLDLQHLRPDTDISVTDDVLEEFSPLAQLREAKKPPPPMLLVRAGRDQARFNDSIDRFISEALRRNVPIQVVNYPSGQHSFDTRDDTEESRTIVRRTIEFIRAHLGG